MPDLYVDSEALREFTMQLDGLAADFSIAIYDTGAGQPLDQALQDLVKADGVCGTRLNNFLTSLARFTDTAATAAEQLDEKLAQESHGHALMSPHGLVARAE